MESRDGRVICEIGIAVAVERLLRAGYDVAVPLVDYGYDLLAFSDRRHWRIQVKASSALSVGNGNRIRLRRGKDGKGTYCPTEVDAFILVNVTSGAVACIPVAATKGRKWLGWRAAEKWSDISVLRKIKTKRC
jgi:hypothetical protein